MKMKKYGVTMTGKSPLLMHGDDVDWRTQITAWRTDPLNKNKCVKGDDRSPAWSWLGYVYHEQGIIGLPSDNLMTCIRDGASKVVLKGSKTFKAQSQSGLVVNEILWPIEINGETVPWAPFEQILGEEDFGEHTALARRHGFSLYVKPAKIGASKHIRVRPRFDTWSARGTITVFDALITKEKLFQILTMAGDYCGIGDWRAASRSPGHFGQFDVTVEVIK